MELLINLRDPPNAPDVPVAPGLGDVIVAMPDGHNWTRLERTRSDWIIIRSPILPTHATLLQMSDVDMAGRHTRYRSHRIDIATIPAVTRVLRQGGARIVALDRATVIAATVRKAEVMA